MLEKQATIGYNDDDRDINEFSCSKYSLNAACIN